MKPMAAAVSVSGIVGCGGQSLAAWTYYNEPMGPTPLGPANLTFLDENSVMAFNGGVCVNNYLDETRQQQLAKGPQVNSSEWKSLVDTFTYEINGRAQGCVAISWIKETWKGGFYRAKIRYEWLFTVGNEALVTYGLFNPEDRLHDMTWKTAYINIKNNRIAWLVSFPKKELTPLRPNKSKDTYWGFSPNFVWNKSCKFSLCVDEPVWKTSGEEKWTWEEDKEGEKKFTDWTKNFSSAFSYINEHNKLTKFHSLVNSRKGTWTRR